MQVKVEDVSNVKKKVHVEIPREEVSTKLDEAYKKLKKTAKIKGYRPGKAPRSVLERHFKKDVHADVIHSLVQDTFPDAILEADLAVLETSELDTPELDPDGSYKYAATVELKPELPPVEVKGLKLKKTRYRVEAEEIDAQVERLRKHLARYEPVEEPRPVEKGDFVALDYEGLKDGQPHPAAPFTSDYSIRIGASGFPEPFDEALEGLSPGETKEIAVDFPGDYKNQDLAGQHIIFRVTLKELHKEVLPQVDDDFATNFGEFETLEDLRAEIRKNLEQGYQKRMDQELQEQVFEHLLKEEFEVPDVLVKHEMDGIIRDTEMKLSQNGLSMQELGLTREQMESQYRGLAEKQVRRHLLLNKIIEQEQLEISDQELEAEYAKVAEALGQPLEAVKSYYDQNPEKRDAFKHALLEKQAIDLIINSADIEEVEAEKEAADTSQGPPEGEQA